MVERTLVLIKPDAMVKRLAGNIISDLYNLDLKMVGLKIVKVNRELAEKHYNDIEERRGKEIFEKLIKHITGEFHKNENVIAIVYEGDDAVKKVREAAGETHPHKANFKSLRGKYGRVDTETDCFENALHSSDSPENAEREIKLWFKDEELIN